MAVQVGREVIAFGGELRNFQIEVDGLIYQGIKQRKGILNRVRNRFRRFLRFFLEELDYFISQKGFSFFLFLFFFLVSGRVDPSELTRIVDDAVTKKINHWFPTEVAEAKRGNMKRQFSKPFCLIELAIINCGCETSMTRVQKISVIII